jgi:glutathionyl-hydroquinone reductase
MRQCVSTRVLVAPIIIYPEIKTGVYSLGVAESLCFYRNGNKFTGLSQNLWVKLDSYGNDYIL